SAPRPPGSPRFPYTTLFRSHLVGGHRAVSAHLGVDPRRLVEEGGVHGKSICALADLLQRGRHGGVMEVADPVEVLVGRSQLTQRSEEHTSELQSRVDLVCRL